VHEHVDVPISMLNACNLHCRFAGEKLSYLFGLFIVWYILSLYISPKLNPSHLMQMHAKCKANNKRKPLKKTLQNMLKKGQRRNSV
jgi:hypothetical protein